jgi:hypothetical protein
MKTWLENLGITVGFELRPSSGILKALKNTNSYGPFICYLPWTNPDLMCLYTRRCSCTDISCPVIKVSSF